MKLNGILAATAACLAGVSSVAAPSAEITPEDVRATQGAVHLAFAAALRDAAVTNSFLFARDNSAESPHFAASARGFFSAPTWKQWQDGAGSAFSDEQISDFFAGAEVLLGPISGEGAVFAYFNPWWDALLVAQTEIASGGGIPAPGRSADIGPLAVKRFEWISGETFRGDPPADPPSVRTVVPGADPLSVEIWRVQRATLARFDAVYGEDPGAEVSFGLRGILKKAGLKELDRPAELARIQVRAGTRLKLLSLQMKNEEAVGVAIRVGDLLRSASVVMFKRHFTDPDHEFFCETFARLNLRAFRSGFVPYGYVPIADGALYVFVNVRLPRLYATVSMPAGLVDGETDRPAIFEWYDLDQAAELLAAWEEEKAKADDAPAEK